MCLERENIEEFLDEEIHEEIVKKIAPIEMVTLIKNSYEKLKELEGNIWRIRWEIKKLKERHIGGEVQIRYPGQLRHESWPNQYAYYKHLYEFSIKSIGKAEKDYQQQVARLEEKIKSNQRRLEQCIEKLKSDPKYKEYQFRKSMCIIQIRIILASFRSIVVCNEQEESNSSSRALTYITSSQFLDLAIRASGADKEISHHSYLRELMQNRRYKIQVGQVFWQQPNASSGSLTRDMQTLKPHL